jgi:hypothetical protein
VFVGLGLDWFDLITTPQIIRHHDSARVFQAMIRYAKEEDRAKLFEQLKGQLAGRGRGFVFPTPSLQTTLSNCLSASTLATLYCACSTAGKRLNRSHGNKSFDNSLLAKQRPAEGPDHQPAEGPRQRPAEKEGKD